MTTENVHLQSALELETFIREHGDNLKSVTITCTATGGRLTAGPLKRAFQTLCWGRGWGLEIEESKGWLETAMCFRVKVPPREAVAAKRILDEWIRTVNE